MANIPKLNENVSAQAVTRTVDRSGVLKEEQRGINDFNQFLQTTLKQGAKLVDSKIYAASSTKAQGELLDYMSDINDEKHKADYFKKNNGDMTNYHADRAKANMEGMQRRLSNISHPKARKELEKQMSYQSQKRLISDLNEENRIIQGLTQEKNTIKNQILATEIAGMKNPQDNEQYQISVGQRLSDIDEDVRAGNIDIEKSIKLRASVLDDSANLRARSLVEGGHSLEALKSVKTNRFGTVSQQRATRDYVISKHLDGHKKKYQALKQQNDLRREQIEAQTYAIDNQVQAIHSDNSLSEIQKVAKTNELKNKYKNNLTSKQFRIMNNANITASRGLINQVLANVNSIPYDQTDTAIFKGSIDALRGISTNSNVPAKTRKEAANALSQVSKKQKLHDTLVEKNAYAPLSKSKRGFDRFAHRKIIDKISNNPKYKDLPVEAEVAIYNLYADGKEKKYISISQDNHTLKTKGDDPYKVNGSKILEYSRKMEPDKFDKVLRAMIKKKKPSLSKSQLNKMYKSFKRDFDDYRDKVDNFEKQEKAILEQYKGLK